MTFTQKCHAAQSADSARYIPDPYLNSSVMLGTLCLCGTLCPHLQMASEVSNCPSV